MRLDFSRPGKPTDSAHINSFNARLRAECLNAHVSESLGKAQERLTSRQSNYNAARSLSALAMLTPREFAELGQGECRPLMARIPRGSSGIQAGRGPWPGFLADSSRPKPWAHQ